MVRHTLKILQHLPQDFLIVSDHFGTLCIKGLIFNILLQFRCFSTALTVDIENVFLQIGMADPEYLRFF